MTRHQKSGSYFYIFFLQKNNLNASNSIRATPKASKDLPLGRGSVSSVDKTDNLQVLLTFFLQKRAIFCAALHAQSHMVAAAQLGTQPAPVSPPGSTS